jgi:hypothetical protein
MYIRFRSRKYPIAKVRTDCYKKRSSLTHSRVVKEFRTRPTTQSIDYNIEFFLRVKDLCLYLGTTPTLCLYCSKTILTLQYHYTNTTLPLHYHRTNTTYNNTLDLHSASCTPLTAKSPSQGRIYRVASCIASVLAILTMGLNPSFSTNRLSAWDSRLICFKSILHSSSLYLSNTCAYIFSIGYAPIEAY